MSTAGAGYYGPRAGTVLNALNSGFGGSFTTSFCNDGWSGLSDTFVVPEPSSVTLLLMAVAGGLLLLALARRRL
jgi:hypothetical protein